MGIKIMDGSVVIINENSMKRFIKLKQILGITFSLILLFTSQSLGSECMECHGDPELAKEDSSGNEYSLFVDLSIYERTVHGEFDCIDCHDNISDLPHDEELEDVKCYSCHEEEAEIYQFHGREKFGECVDLPYCKDCHGTHDVFLSSSKESKVNPLNLPNTCGRCHEDLGLVRKYEIPFEKPVGVFKNSVHGKASLGGIYMAATCNDCHSTEGTAHKILSPNHPQSTINHFNIAATCGKCHKNVENNYNEGIHGKMAARGETDTPTCTNCHGEHGILSHYDERSPVSPSRVAEATCSPCHESARLNDKYSIPSGRLKSWIDSYHGLKSRAGDVRVANCASCHGAHRILPSSDPASLIHLDNLQSTCGRCHPDISTDLAQTSIHGTPGITHTPIANFFRQVYIVAIVIIIGLMSIYVLVDIYRQIKLVTMKKQITRMNYNELWQHMFLFVTFTVLVITGFSLRFSDSWWVKYLFGWEGGFALRGVIHRTSAVIFVITVVWHMIYFTGARGRQFLKDMIPVRKDISQFFEMVLFNLGLRKSQPKMERFGYAEKAEYWALVWGSAVMIVSGFFLWFDNLAVKWFPKGFLDVMLVIHYYEAWLATLAILIWHMYFTIYKAGVYPMNTSWLTTKMPQEMYKHEHADDPALYNPDTLSSAGEDKADSSDPKRIERI